MKQLGTGLHNYHDAHKKFPPAGINFGWCRRGNNVNGTTTVSNTIVTNTNGWVYVLPYLEQTGKADGLNLTQPMSNQMNGNTMCCGPNDSTGILQGDVAPTPTTGNGPIVASLIETFLCPSDPGDKLLPATGVYSIKDGSGLRGAKTNYDFSAMGASSVVLPTSVLTYDCDFWRLQTMSFRRMFGENSNTTIAMVLDGTSNTVAVCESTLEVANGTRAAWGYRAWVQVGIDIGAPTGINIWDRPANSGTNYKYGRVGDWWWSASLHPGGVQVVMADGAVKFLRETTSTTILDRLARMADGQANLVP